MQPQAGRMGAGSRHLGTRVPHDALPSGSACRNWGHRSPHKSLDNMLQLAAVLVGDLLACSVWISQGVDRAFGGANRRGILVLPFATHPTATSCQMIWPVQTVVAHLLKLEKGLPDSEASGAGGDQR